MWDTRGQSVRAHGSHDRRGRKQASSCGGCVEFCLSRRPGTSLRCVARYGLRGFRIGEAAHPGLQDFASCWTVRVSGARCPLFQLRKGPHAWIPHPQLRHLKVRSPGIWFSLEVMSRPRESIPRLEASGQNHREGLTQRALQEFPSKGR